MTTATAPTRSPELHAVSDEQERPWKAAAQSAASTAQSAAQSAARTAQSAARSAAQAAADRPDRMRLARDVAGVLVPFLVMRRLSRGRGLLGLAAGLASTGALADLVALVRRRTQSQAQQPWTTGTDAPSVEEPATFSAEDLTMSEDALRADLEGPKH